MEANEHGGKQKWKQMQNRSKQGTYLWWVWCRRPFSAKKMRENPFAHKDGSTKEEDMK